MIEDSKYSFKMKLLYKGAEHPLIGTMTLYWILRRIHLQANGESRDVVQTTYCWQIVASE